MKLNPSFYHIDIDAFFASVEQALDPTLQGRPVIVGSGVISSCSYEARTFGLHAGMPVREARQRCPHGVYLAGNAHTYGRVSARVEELCRACAPTVERASIDEFYCNMTGCERLYPDLFRCAQELALTIRHVARVPVSIGIGDNRLIAKTASSFAKPAGIAMIFPGRGPDFLAPMDISEVDGIGRRREALFRSMNIHTASLLRAIPRRALRAMLGRTGDHIADTCRGIEPRQPARTGLPATISRETTFEVDTCDRTHIRAMLWYLIERAAVRLRGLGLEARTIEVRIRYFDFKSDRRSVTLAAYTAGDAVFFKAAAAMLDAIYARRVALRLVGITLSGFRRSERVTELLLFEPAPPPRDLYTALDTIRGKYGHTVIVGGPSVTLIDGLDVTPDRVFKLRTPSLTQ